MATEVDLTPPPLTRWQWTWRVTVAFFLSLVIFASPAYNEWRGARWLFWVDLGLGVVSFCLYLFHRRWPVRVALVTIAFGALSTSASGPGVFAFISMATRRRWREILPIAAMNVVVGGFFMMIEPYNTTIWYVGLLVNVLATGVATAVGLYIGARRELLATLRDRADRAEREQSMRITQAQANERARIAREMHDVLAHRISLVAMHAGALSYRKDLSAEETTRAADVISRNAHQALTDLREILGVLREPALPRTGERPQPTLRDIGELVEEERRAGAHLRVAYGPALDAVPDAIGRHAYRMVQESLTNARKHAPDTTVDVYVAGEPGGSLRIEVRNPLRVGSRLPGQPLALPGAGFGLVGLAERAALSGGGLEHMVTPEGDFVLRAWLPWPA